METNTFSLPDANTDSHLVDDCNGSKSIDTEQNGHPELLDYLTDVAHVYLVFLARVVDRVNMASRIILVLTETIQSTRIGLVIKIICEKLHECIHILHFHPVIF